MDKIKQKTPKHLAETCWNNSKKSTLLYSHYTVSNFAKLIFACLYFASIKFRDFEKIAKFSAREIK